jgi:hypothetical protein
VVTGDGSSLRQVLEDAAAESGCSLRDLTVQNAQKDPFRLDTPAGRRDGKWLADTTARLGLGRRKIHPRGVHYMLVMGGAAKPDGTPYANTDDDWSWLVRFPVKSARWLGYIPFDQITDERNAAPVVREFSRPQPHPFISVGRLEVELPDAGDIEPVAYCSDFRGVQPYHLVLFGEKSSLASALEPVAETHQADLYLPTGDISDTMLHQMAAASVADGRPMVVLCFSDADPAGWNMPVVIARKLQALRVLLGGPDFVVRRAALTPDQVREYGLPSTPLKPEELRGDKWRAAMGTEQTEIDALATLRPDLLRQVARDAIAPFFDNTLGRRVRAARQAWDEEAAGVLVGAVDADVIDRMRAEAEQALEGLRDEINDLSDRLRIDPGDVALPEVVIPQAEVEYPPRGTSLLDSRWPFADQCRALIESKAYRNGDTP